MYINKQGNATNLHKYFPTENEKELLRWDSNPRHKKSCSGGTRTHDTRRAAQVGLEPTTQEELLRWDSNPRHTACQADALLRWDSNPRHTACQADALLRWDSNPRHTACQADALPLSYRGSSTVGSNQSYTRAIGLT